MPTPRRIRVIEVSFYTNKITPSFASFWNFDDSFVITVKKCIIEHNCYYAFFLVCCGCDTSYIVSDHIQCQTSMFTLSLCRGHSWRVRLAKQETLTPPGHMVSPLVCRGPWMFTVVSYCWYHSDSASVLLYFTLQYLSLCTCLCQYVWLNGHSELYCIDDKMVMNSFSYLNRKKWMIIF